MHSDDADDLFESSTSAEDEDQPTADLPTEDAVGAVKDVAPADQRRPEDLLDRDDDDPASIFADWEPPAPIAEPLRRRVRVRVVVAAGAVLVVLASMLAGHHSRRAPSPSPGPALESHSSRSSAGSHHRHHPSARRARKPRNPRAAKPPRRKASRARASAREPSPRLHTTASGPTPSAARSDAPSQFTNEFTP